MILMKIDIDAPSDKSFRCNITQRDRNIICPSAIVSLSRENKCKRIKVREREREGESLKNIQPYPDCKAAFCKKKIVFLNKIHVFALQIFDIDFRKYL